MKYFVLLLLTFTFSTQALAEKVLFVVTNSEKMLNTDVKTGFWLSELTHPYYEITKAGIKVDIASLNGGKAPIDSRSMDMNDSKNKRFLGEKSQLIENTLKVSDLKPKDYKSIFYVGGYGAMWDLAESDSLARFASQVYESGGLVAAVCHGPAALLKVKLSNGEYLVKGKKLTGFTNKEEKAIGKTKNVPFLLEDELKKRGGRFRSSAIFQKKVVSDSRLITGQNPASALGVGVEIVKQIRPVAGRRSSKRKK